MIPKGILLIIGGAEDKGDDKTPDTKDKKKEFERFEILRKILPKDHNRRIEVITTGSEVQSEVKRQYHKAFKKLGYPHTGFMPINSKHKARTVKYLQRIEDAGAVFFSGGDQFRLSTILGGTNLVDNIKKRYYEDPDFIVAGTSAGAMVMSKVMITGGGGNEVLLKKDLSSSSGFGLLKYCIVDTHFIARCRFGRLAQAVIVNPGQLGVGLGEDTALIIRRGFDATCTGSGMVVIIDGREIEQTNITDVENDVPVFVENLKVHLLTKGCRFNLKQRKLANPAINLKHKKK